MENYISINNKKIKLTEATCKDCIHYEVCADWQQNVCDTCKNRHEEYKIDDNGVCNFFKPKSRFVELPCNVGDTVYFIKSAFSFLPEPKPEKIRKIEMVEFDVIFRTENRAFNDVAINLTVFLTRSEAEQALKERG